MDRTKTLILVESPAKAKSIQKYLGSDYLVRASFGHIKDLPSDGLAVDEENDFRPKYRLMSEKKPQIQAILDASKFAKEILIASDPDREGEAIAFHLKDILQSTNLPIKRVKFDEITKKKILEVLQKPQELDQNLYDAQQARRSLDRLVGYLSSPFLNKSLARGKDEKKKFSAGRVQSVVLRLIADREKEIQTFQPEEYWNVTAHFSENSDAQKPQFSAKLAEKKKITNQAEAQEVEQKLLSASFSVTKVKHDNKKRPPEPPFTTPTLCAAASASLKFSTEKTMKLAQTLYESGLITYMRTDSVRISEEALDSVRDWIGQKNYSLPKKPNQYENKSDQAQDAHEAIRPTDVFREATNLSSDENLLYQLIWRRFVASQMLPAIFAATQIEITSSNGELLKLSGSILKEENWIILYKGHLKNQDTLLPNLKKSQEVYLVPPKIKLEQKFTQPPKRYTEGSLVLELDKQGIGRPGTYAAIFSKIASREYVVKKGDSYQATEIGQKVAEILSKYFKFVDYHYTAQMEANLDFVADGRLSYQKMMKNFYSNFFQELKEAYIDCANLGEDLCPKCSMPMELKHGNFGYFLACLNYPVCKETVSVQMVDGKIEKRDRYAVIEEITCPKCSAPMRERDGKWGPFYSCSKYPRCYGMKKMILQQNCPECQNLGMTFFKDKDNKLKLSCIKYPECKGVEEAPKKYHDRFIPLQDLGFDSEITTVKKLWNKE